MVDSSLFGRMIYIVYMDVSKNRGTPKWMVKIMENPIKMDNLGGFLPIFGLTPIDTYLLTFFFQQVLKPT